MDSPPFLHFCDPVYFPEHQSHSGKGATVYSESICFEREQNGFFLFFFLGESLFSEGGKKFDRVASRENTKSSESL